jgi:hypothetical protein
MGAVALAGDGDSARRGLALPLIFLIGVRRNSMQMH